MFEFQSDGCRIYLLDTPGFNDTKRSDIDTLGILAAYLGASYSNGVKIHGIILLHPINVNRMSGSSVRDINMTMAMCGFQLYRNLAIVTTMWPGSLNYHERAAAERREGEILRDESFFGSLVNREAIAFRHNENGYREITAERRSAQRIVAHLINQADIYPPEVLQLQREVVDQKKRLGETEAGMAIGQQLHRIRQEHALELQRLKSELQDQLAKKDTYYANVIRELKSEMYKKIEKSEEEKKALTREIQDLVLKEDSSWKKKIEEMTQQLRSKRIQKESELQLLEDSYRASGWPVNARQREGAGYPTSEDENAINQARQEALRARESHEKFIGKTNGIMSNAANGIASGLASGIISAGLSPTRSILCADRRYHLLIWVYSIAFSSRRVSILCGDVAMVYSVSVDWSNKRPYQLRKTSLSSAV